MLYCCATPQPPLYLLRMRRVLVLLMPAHMMLWVALSAVAGPGALAWAWIRADEGGPRQTGESDTGPP